MILGRTGGRNIRRGRACRCVGCVGVGGGCKTGSGGGDAVVRGNIVRIGVSGEDGGRFTVRVRSGSGSGRVSFVDGVHGGVKRFRW